MDCKVCYCLFDHSKNRPYSLNNCSHTFCNGCLKKIQSMSIKKCPYCKATFTAIHANLSLLELIPQSKYDTTKIEVKKLINEVKDLKTQLQLDCKIKKKDQISKLYGIKRQIRDSTLKKIDDLITQKSKLINELYNHQLSIENNFRKLECEKDVDSKLIDLSNYLITDFLNEDELENEKIKIEKLRNKLNQLIVGVADKKEDFELIDSEKVIFAGIKSTEKTTGEYKQIADDLFVKKENEGAVFFYDKAINSKTNEDCKELFSLYIDKAATLTEMAQYDKALECYNKIISFDSTNYMAYYYQGKTLDSMKNFKDALDSFNKAIELNDNQLFREARLRVVGIIDLQGNETLFLKS